MRDHSELVKLFRVRSGKHFRLKDHDPAWDGDDDIPRAERKAFAAESLAGDIVKLAALQERLYAADTWSLLIIFQALDAAGKDGAIKHVMSGVNPQGCQVHAFKQPSAEELDHDFLWRCYKAIPERGRIGIFNRSYYEEVLVARVHPELIAKQRIPGAKPNKEFWRERFESINAFEQHLTRNGTTIVKFFLNVSRDEQRRRFLERIENPEKHWKFDAHDLVERGFWDDYQSAYEDAIAETSSKHAPWYVIPADHKWVARGLVAKILVKTLEDLDVQTPEPTAEQLATIAAAREQLHADSAD